MPTVTSTPSVGDYSDVVNAWATTFSPGQNAVPITITVDVSFDASESFSEWTIPVPFTLPGAWFLYLAKLSSLAGVVVNAFEATGGSVTISGNNPGGSTASITFELGVVFVPSAT